MAKRGVGWLLLGLLLPWLAWAGAPSIVLKDFDGGDRNVNEFIGHGKWVVVAVWAHDCHVCNEEIHHMKDFHQAHKDNDAIVLGVTIDGYQKKKLAKGFVDRHALPFTNLIAEPEEEVILKFGAGRFVGTPTFYVYTPAGQIVAQNIGPVTRQDIEDFMAQHAAESKAKNG